MASDQSFDATLQCYLNITSISKSNQSHKKRKREMKKVERNVQVGNIRCWKQKKLVLRNYGALKHVLPALRRESNSRRNNSNKLARKNI